MKHTPQRFAWSGTPERLSPVWTLTKDRRAAICELWSHQFGFELRLMISGDDLPRTHVCRDQQEFIAVDEAWRKALEEQGWTKLGA
jgi:hypothetical protein